VVNDAVDPRDQLLKTAIVVAVVVLHLAVLAASVNLLGVKPKMPPEHPVTFLDLQAPTPPRPLVPPPPVPPAKPQVQLPVIADKATTPEQEAQAVPAQQTPAPAPAPAAPAEPDYLPQFKIDQVPTMPDSAILARIVYPPLAAKQGIEAVVFLELYIDDRGVIRKVNVLKDPGFGFAEAAVKALDGVQVRPAQAQGKPVAVRFRYNMRFKLK